MFRSPTGARAGMMGFPRIHGDVPIAQLGRDQKLTFSPHTRGCSGHLVLAFDHLAGFPRIRGDVPTIDATLIDGQMFSPHTRGYSRDKACNEEDSSEII